MKELSELLTDESGIVRPFKEFKDDALAVHQKYNVNWLRTEFDTAKGTARMAARWKDFEAESDLFHLQYNTAKDNKVRPQHRVWNGITLPISHPFWDTHYPPVDWNCRCDVQQVANSTPQTPDLRLKEVKKPNPIFAFNAGKQQLVFQNSHPYIKTTTSKTLNELEAVKDYGLKDLDYIYEQKSRVSKDKSIFNKEQAAKWWEDIDNMDYSFDGRFGENTKFKVHLLEDIAQKFIASPEKRKNLDELLGTVSKPNEVYERNSKLYFVKFFDSHLLEIELKNNGKRLDINDYKLIEKSNAVKSRKGILQFTDK